MKDSVQPKVSSSQNLLSTIYRQSWHPVASTLRQKARKPLTTTETQSIAGNLRCPSPFQSHTSPRKHQPVTKPDTIRPYKMYDHYRSVVDNSVDAENELTKSMKYVTELLSHTLQSSSPSTENTAAAKIGNETNLNIKSRSSVELNSFGVKQMHTPLSVWRRRLKTYVSNSHTPNRRTDESQSDSAPQLIATATNHSWTNVTSSGKGYRALKYPNPTLAAMCLKGKSPPVQSRPDKIATISKTECLHSLLSNCVDSQTAKNHENNFEDSRHVIDTEHEQPCNTIFSNERCNDYENTAGSEKLEEGYSSKEILTPYSPVFDDVPSTSAETSPVNGECDDIQYDWFSATQFEENNELPDLKNCTYETEYSNVPSSSEFDNSDLSENELYSDSEEEENESSLIGQTVDDVEMYRRLYQNENNSATESQNEILALCEEVDDKTLLFSDDPLYNSNEESSEVDYQFALPLPAEMQKYNLHELSLLPSDVNWKSVVDFCKVFPLVKFASHGKRGKAKSRLYAKAKENRKVFESVVERLLAMEKLQSRTAQQEEQRNYHNIHHRPNMTRAKSVNGKSTTSSEQKCNATEVSRSNRRNSNPNVSLRMAWATETTQGQSSIFKKACKDGDLTILHKHWLACCKSSTRRHSMGRKQSLSEGSCTKPQLDSAQRRSRSFRSRSSSLSTYVYQNSERSKDDRMRFYMFSNHQPKSCQACRERTRKMRSREVTVPQNIARPRTPRPNSRPGKSRSDKQPVQRARSHTVPSPGARQSPVSASVVSPLLWQDCRPAYSNLQMAKTAFKNSCKEYDITSKRLRRKHFLPEGHSLTATNKFTSAVTISPVLINKPLI